MINITEMTIQELKAAIENKENEYEVFKDRYELILEQLYEELNKKEAEPINENTFARTLKQNYQTVVATTKGDFGTINHVDYGTDYNDNHFYNYNYFHTKEEAQEITNKFNFLLRLQRLHDEFCPGFKPDESVPYNEHISVTYVHENEAGKRWIVNKSFMDNKLDVYFSTEAIAYKVCKILNNEEVS